MEIILEFPQPVRHSELKSGELALFQDVSRSWLTLVSEVDGERCALVLATAPSDGHPCPSVIQLDRMPGVPSTLPGTLIARPNSEASLPRSSQEYSNGALVLSVGQPPAICYWNQGFRVFICISTGKEVDVKPSPTIYSEWRLILRVVGSPSHREVELARFPQT